MKRVLQLIQASIPFRFDGAQIVLIVDEPRSSQQFMELHSDDQDDVVAQWPLGTPLEPYVLPFLKDLVNTDGNSDKTFRLSNPDGSVVTKYDPTSQCWQW